MKLLYLDCETTGLVHYRNSIHQVAGIIEIDGHVAEEFNLKFRPADGCEISQEALDVAGVSVADLRAREMSSAQAAEEVKRIFDKYVSRYNKADKFHMVGQNTKFDYDFLMSWFKRHNEAYGYSYITYHLIDIISTTAIFRAAGKISLPNMKLVTVAAHFGIPLAAHDALNDVRATREIFQRYVRLIQQIDMIGGSGIGAIKNMSGAEEAHNIKTPFDDLPPQTPKPQPKAEIDQSHVED